jgi:hypothetical protein
MSLAVRVIRLVHQHIRFLAASEFARFSSIVAPACAASFTIWMALAGWEESQVRT